jgi:beta-phosphoglucomutase-like phosphatase (HAD superfamily)
MASYEAVVFDFGGVLTDGYSEATYHLEISEKFGVDVDRLMPFLKANKFLSNLLVGTETEENVVRAVMAEFPEAVAIEPRAINSDSFIPSKTALDAVRRLKERTGMRVAVGSNIFPISA